MKKKPIILEKLQFVSLKQVATLPINPMIPGGAEANYADCVGWDKNLGFTGRELPVWEP